MDSSAVEKELKNFLDAEGRLIRYPAKHRLKQASLLYLWSKLEAHRDYTEKEINQLLDKWHLFHDVCLLRRELYNRRMLGRERDGSRYWKEFPGEPDGDEAARYGLTAYCFKEWLPNKLDKS